MKIAKTVPVKNNKQKTINEKKQGYSPRSAILVTLLIYFGTQIITGIIIGLFFYLSGKSSEEITDLVNNSVAVQFTFIAIVEALSLWFLWQFLRYRNIKLSDIGIKRPKLENLLYAIPAYGVYFIILLVSIGLLQGLTDINTDQEQQIGFEGATGLLPLTLVFISLVILPAVVEEIMIRGFLYSGLLKKYSKKIAALIASLIFAAAHLQLGSGEPPLWVAAVDTFILSMVLIYLRERTGNIWSGVAVHMIKNSFAFISLFIVHLI